MIPSAIFEAITQDNQMNTLGIDESRVFELQSINQDETPDTRTHLIIIDMQEANSAFGAVSAINKAPRIMEISVHISWDVSRDFRAIDHILNRIDAILLPMEHVTGSDDIRVTCIAKQARTRNLQDDGWRTITRHATYGVLYDELAA